MYVVLADTDTGLAKFTCCQPLLVSPEKVADASNCPEEVHRCATCVPVFWLDL